MNKVIAGLSLSCLILIATFIIGQTFAQENDEFIVPAGLDSSGEMNFLLETVSNDLEITKHKKAFSCLMEVCDGLNDMDAAVEAVKSYEARRPASPELGEAYYQLAEVQLKCWDMESALSNYEKAIPLLDSPARRGDSVWKIARQKWYAGDHVNAYNDFIEYLAEFSPEHGLKTETDEACFRYLSELVWHVCHKENGDQNIQQSLQQIDDKIAAGQGDRTHLQLAKAIILTASGVQSDETQIPLTKQNKDKDTRILLFNLYKDLRFHEMEKAKIDLLRYTITGGEEPSSIIRNINAIVDSLDRYIDRSATFDLIRWIEDSPLLTDENQRNSINPEELSYFYFNLAVISASMGDGQKYERLMKDAYLNMKGVMGGDLCGTYYAEYLRQWNQDGEAKAICDAILQKKDFSIPYLRALLITPRFLLADGKDEEAMQWIDNTLPSLPLNVNFHIEDCRMSLTRMRDNIKGQRMPEQEKRLAQQMSNPINSQAQVKAESLPEEKTASCCNPSAGQSCGSCSPNSSCGCAGK